MEVHKPKLFGDRREFLRQFTMLVASPTNGDELRAMIAGATFDPR
jgi:hypothetical protein